MDSIQMTNAVLQPAQAAPHQPPTRHQVAAEVTKMAGVLWDQVLEAAQENGLSDKDLGTGGEQFQGMFNWDIAEHDFGQYDGQLVEAALREYGMASPTPTSGNVPGTDLPNIVQQGGVASGGMSGESVTTSASNGPAVAGGDQVVDDIIAKAKAFAKGVWPQIKEAAAEINVSPIAVLAQSALETGWGAAEPGNNLFGVKAAPGQPSDTLTTNEDVKGKMVSQTAAFRTYTSPAASIDDYVSHIVKQFHGVAGQTTVAGFAQALQASGYATDASYASKLIEISQSPMMAEVLQSLGVNSQVASAVTLSNAQKPLGVD